MQLIDSHCHLTYYGPQEIDEIMDQCSQRNILAVNNICTKVDEFEEKILPTSRAKNIFCSLGDHPCNLPTNVTSVQTMQSIYNQHGDKIVGVGETGFDFFYPDFDAKKQIESFTNHNIFATDNDLPLIIHSRNAEDVTYQEIKNASKSRGVIHCFTGSKQFAKNMLDLDYYISLSGIVTFKNATDLQEVAKYIPLDRLLIETDSPYLSPIRGKKNFPYNVSVVAEFLSTMLNVDIVNFANITTDNFFKLFNKASL